MAQFLQSVLGAKEPLFSNGLAQLEKNTGSSGVDTRLIADIIEKAHSVMRKLGLDTRDTTGHELYFALVEAVRHGTAESLLIDADYVLLIVDGKVISFNLIDIIENSHHELPYDKQITSHGRRSLRGELVWRYMEHKRSNQTVTSATALLIGLLPESDAWYNDNKHKQKPTENFSKELGK